MHVYVLGGLCVLSHCNCHCQHTEYLIYVFIYILNICFYIVQNQLMVFLVSIQNKVSLVIKNAFYMTVI